MGKFIYVFNVDVRDKLLALDYKLLKSNEQKNMFVFENQSHSKQCFSLDDEELVFSDTMTF